EHALRIRDGLAKDQKRVMHLLAACLIPVGHFETARTILAHFDRILQGEDLFEVLRVCWINESAHTDADVPRRNLFSRKGVPAFTVYDGVSEMVLVDHLHRHVALARVGQRYCYGSSAEIKHSH